jgi:hypothetical protein
VSLKVNYLYKRAAKSGKVLKEAMLVLQELSSDTPVSPCEESVDSAGKESSRTGIEKKNLSEPVLSVGTGRSW